VITSLLSPTEPYPENIQVHYGNWAQAQFSDGDIHSLFQRCKYVITPLVESTRPNGQSATLQAMSCGKAVILTRTEGLWDRENMKHLENCYLVSPRDSQELGSAISYFESNPDEVERIGRNARETVLKFYTTARFAKRLESIVLSLTA
jgi:glycosyltransferase involved in cell wall biosynthesis